MQDVEESSGVVVKMGPATLYGAPKRFVHGGLAEETHRLDALVYVARTNLRPGMA